MQRETVRYQRGNFNPDEEGVASMLEKGHVFAEMVDIDAAYLTLMKQGCGRHCSDVICYGSGLPHLRACISFSRDKKLYVTLEAKECDCRHIQCVRLHVTDLYFKVKVISKEGSWNFGNVVASNIGIDTNRVGLRSKGRKVGNEKIGIGKDCSGSIIFKISVCIRGY